MHRAVSTLLVRSYQSQLLAPFARYHIQISQRNLSQALLIQDLKLIKKIPTRTKSNSYSLFTHIQRVQMSSSSSIKAQDKKSSKKLAASNKKKSDEADPNSFFQLHKHEDGKVRCWGKISDPDMIHYHDNEWGMPQQDISNLFMQWTLQLNQAGLMWKTILKKRNGFKDAFANWDYKVVADFTEDDIQNLIVNRDIDIIHHQGKIRATVALAQMIRDIENNRTQYNVEEHGFPQYMWRYAPTLETERLWTDTIKKTKGISLHMRADVKKTGEGNYRANAVDPTHSQFIFNKHFRDMKRHNIKFLGPAITLSLFQAIGFVNHHHQECFAHEKCENAYTRIPFTIGGAQLEDPFLGEPPVSMKKKKKTMKRKIPSSEGQTENTRTRKTRKKK